VFLDRNGDGIFNKGENFVFAEEDGAYGFPAFPDGAYAVRVSRPDDDWANGAVAAPVRRGRTTWRDVSAARVTPARETVSGTVINDADFDGTRDGGETGLAGVRVYLDLNRNGHYTPGEPSAFTDAAGDYRIADVPPGRYRVAIPDLGPGFEYTRGVDKTLVVLPGSPHDVDFAIGYDGGNGMIHGVLFNDRDGDGKQDANEPGMPGVTMSLSERQWMNSSNIFGSRAVVTDAGGYYKFPRLRRGEYTLSAAYAAIEWQTPQQQQTVVVPLSPGQRALRSWSLEENGTAQISGKAFVDRNRDGAWGSEDLAAPGWWVYADLDRDGKRDGDEPASQTSSTGAYALTELMSGTYLVRFAPSPGDDWTFTHGNAATEITLTPRQQLRLNAGAAGPPSGVITGTVYYDRDADIITTGDPVKSGVTVFLDLNGNRTYDPGVDRTAVTDADGRYRFTKVPSGPYYVIPIAPTGWAMSTPFRGASVADEVTTEFPALGVSDRGRIPGRLFHDVNRDGKLTLSQGDRFLTDYTVYVDADNDGTLDAGERSTQTTEAGAFIFTALPLESYVVRFIPRADDVDHPVVAGSITVTFPMPAMTLLFAAVTP
jgi:serine-aspartate repeat-containing protein C/D/E